MKKTKKITATIAATIILSVSAATPALAAPNAGQLSQSSDGTTACSYFLAPPEAIVPPDDGIGISLMDNQMKQQASFVGWDFEGVWTICEGNDYPRLGWEQADCNAP